MSVSPSEQERLNNVNEFLLVWQLATTELLACVQDPDSLDGFYEQAKRLLGYWPDERKNRIAAEGTHGLLIKRVFRDQYVADYGAARLAAGV